MHCSNVNAIVHSLIIFSLYWQTYRAFNVVMSLYIVRIIYENLDRCEIFLQIFFNNGLVKKLFLKAKGKCSFNFMGALILPEPIFHQNCSF